MEVVCIIKIYQNSNFQLKEKYFSNRFCLSLRNPVETMEHAEILKLVAKYKFALAFENAICTDYITEKFWRPFKVGTVPIVYGSDRFQV
jgi:hypothetical protein